MKSSWWEVRNRDGEYVCRRNTRRACKDLLDRCVGLPHWSNGPYTIWRVTEEKRETHRESPQPQRS